MALAVEATKHEIGQSMYARIMWYVTQNVHPDLRAIPGFNWDRMKMGMNDILKSYSEPWNINNFAAFACQARDIEKARVLLPQALDQPVFDVWGSQETFDACWKWAMGAAELRAPKP